MCWRISSDGSKHKRSDVAREWPLISFEMNWGEMRVASQLNSILWLMVQIKS
jgi:hypothetical protein